MAVRKPGAPQTTRLQRSVRRVLLVRVSTCGKAAPAFRCLKRLVAVSRLGAFNTTPRPAAADRAVRNVAARRCPAPVVVPVSAAVVVPVNAALAR